MYFICTYGEQTPMKAGQICTGTDFYNNQNKEAQAIYLTWLKMLKEVYDFDTVHPPIFDLRTTPNTFVIKGMDIVRFYGVEIKGPTIEVDLESLTDGLVVAKAIAQRDATYEVAYVKRLLRNLHPPRRGYYGKAVLTSRIKVITEYTAHEIALLSKYRTFAE